MKGETLNCRQCRMPFKQRNATGPEPLFCSGACRQAAFRLRHGTALSKLNQDERSRLESCWRMLNNMKAVLAKGEAPPVSWAEHCIDMLEETFPEIKH